MTRKLGLIALAAAFSLPHSFTAVPAAAGWKDYLKKSADKMKRKRMQKEVKTDSVSAVRGLEEDAADAEEETGMRDYEALRWLESITVTEGELRRFIREGRLAP